MYRSNQEWFYRHGQAATPKNADEYSDNWLFHKLDELLGKKD
jgi:hypothetical protein